MSEFAEQAMKEMRDEVLEFILWMSQWAATHAWDECDYAAEHSAAMVEALNEYRAKYLGSETRTI